MLTTIANSTSFTEIPTLNSEETTVTEINQDNSSNTTLLNDSTSSMNVTYLTTHKTDSTSTPGNLVTLSDSAETTTSDSTNIFSNYKLIYFFVYLTVAIRN